MRPPIFNLRDEVEQLFEKKFHYQKPSNDGDAAWLLPQPEEPIFSEFYQYDMLQEFKERLNAVKSKLNDYGTLEWSNHTNRRDPSGEVSWRLKNETKAEFVTVAWCKFFECLHRYPLVEQPKLNTLHLCEAPGAFIAALNHYLYSTHKEEEIKWRWRSTTLNPYYEGNPLNEMIIDDRFIYHTLDNWLFHADFTGNLINVDNIDHMTSRCLEDFPDGVQLITADGSIDCAAQPDCQEEIVARLFFAELLAALSILSDGGNFVIKMFTLYEACSVSVLYLLNCIFEQVHLHKPATSKRGNSEIYVICLHYNKQSPGLTRLLQSMRAKLAQPQDAMVIPLFAKSQIPSDFLRQHEIGCRLFMQLQCAAIDNSIYAYESKDRNYLRHLHQLRGLVSSMYYNRYKVKRLADELCVVKKQHTSQALGFWMPVYGGSYSERESLKQGDLLKQIYCLRRELNQLEKCPNSAISYSHSSEREKPLQLRLSRGAPVDTLWSSLFVSEPVLVLRDRLHSTFELDPLWQMSPSCSLGADLKNLAYAPSSVAEPFYKAQQRFFVALLEALMELKPSKIVFHKFPFLTHYAVSLLLFLSDSVYQGAEFDSNMDSHTITLNLLREQGLEQLSKLLPLLADEQVHSVLDIQELHKNPFSQALLQYNNNALLGCYRGMLGEDSFPMPPPAQPTCVIKETANVAVVLT